MPISRNDPCPCGSGRKYKRCCQANEEHTSTPIGRLRTLATSSVSGSPTRPAGDLRERGGGTEWEVDLIPIPANFDDEPEARPAVLMVTADGPVLHVDIVKQPSAEHYAIAELLQGAIEAAITASETRPTVITTRYDPVAVALERILGPRGVRVASARSLPHLDGAFEQLEQELLHGFPGGLPAGTSPYRWAGWGWPADIVARSFGVFAQLFRAAPWTLLADDEVLSVVVEGRPWYISVLGQTADMYGLAFYESFDDIASLFDERIPPEESFHDLRGAALSVLFSRFDELPPGMSREIRGAGWEVAGPRAYPVLTVMNTPAGGITAAQREDLLTAMHAVAGFVTANREAFEASIKEDQYPPPMSWTDVESGVEIEYHGAWESAPPWPFPDRLAPACASGPAAQPGVWIADGDDGTAQLQADHARLGRFGEWLRAGATTKQGLGARRAADRDVEIATTLVASLHQSAAPIPGINEIDLRLYLYGDYPRSAVRLTNHERMLDGLVRFFDFLGTEGIDCPWARPLLDDLDSVTMRVDSAPRESQEEDSRESEHPWYAELAADLVVRALQPPAPSQPVEPGGEGWEAYQRLSRSWLRWRDEVIAEGETDPERVLNRLIERVAHESSTA